MYFLSNTVGILSLAALVSSVKLFAINTNTPSDNIISYDTLSNEIKNYETDWSSELNFFSGATVCQDTYYAFASSGDGKGEQFMLTFNFSSQKYISYPIRNDPDTYIEMTFGCTSTPGKVLSASTYFYYYDQTRYFDHILSQFSFGSDGSVNGSTIGGFYEGHEWNIAASFFFDTEANEVWGSFQPDQNMKILDTNSGDIKNDHRWDEEDGVLYFVIPQTLKDNVFKGAMILDEEYNFVNITISGHYDKEDADLVIEPQIKNADYLKSVDAYGNIAICGSTAYVISTNEFGTNITSFDIFNGMQTKVYQMEETWRNIHSIACK
eukprot:139029_1